MTAGPARPAGRPVPVPDERSAPFWDATAAGVLAIARCRRCRSFVHPPDVVCPSCHDPDPAYAFEPVDGGGTIRSWTVVRQSFLPGFEVPFVLVDVALDEAAGVRLIGRLVDGPDAAVRIGDAVTVTFEHVDGHALPAFTLAAAP